MLSFLVTEINSYGNLETIPPYTSKGGVSYKADRIMGKHFDRLPVKALLNFLYG
jgi:protein-arginine deiminase